MPNKFVDDKKRYLHQYYIGDFHPAGGRLRVFLQKLVYALRRWKWERRLQSMSEGEILARYYELTKRPEPDGFGISIRE